MKRVTLCLALILIASSIVAHSAAAQAGAQSLDVSLADLGYPDALLTGPTASIVYVIAVPAAWQPAGTNTLLLDTALSGSRAAVRVELDGVPVHGVLLEPGDHQLAIPLPLDILQNRDQPRHTLRLSLDSAEECQTLEHTTFSIHSAGSRLSLQYTLKPVSLDLGRLPFPFVQRSLLPDRVRFILPDPPSATDVRIALAISARLGAASRGDVLVSSSTVSEVSEETLAESHLVIIGRPDANPLLQAIPLPAPVITGTRDAGTPYTFQWRGQPVNTGDGVLQLLASPWSPEHAVLVVSGLDDAALLRAGQAAAAQPTLAVQGDVALVYVAQPLTETYELSPTVTLGVLGYADVVLNGGRGEDAEFRFALPAGWAITPAAELRLDFAHADTGNSLLAVLNVHLNGEPLTSITLDDQNATRGDKTVPLPVNQVRPGANLVQVEPFIKPDLECGVNPESVPTWVRIFNSSTLTLPHVLRDTPLDLNRYPSFLTTAPGLHDVMVALPAVPSPAERDGALALMARLGAEQDSLSFMPQVQLGDAPIDQALRETHIIAIGRPSNNPLLVATNSVLPQPFVAGEDMPDQSAGPLQVRLPEDLSVGLIELLRSPWGKAYSMLAITGTNDEAVRWSLNAVNDPRLARSLEGQLVSVRGTQIEVLPVPLARTLLQPTPTASSAVAATPSPAPASGAEETGASGPGALLVVAVLIGVGVLAALGIWRGRRMRSG